MTLIWAGVLFILLVGVLMAVLIIVSRAGLGDFVESKAQYSYTKKRYFLTRAEHELYDDLVAAVGERYYVFAQVHLDAILDHKVRGQNWNAARRHINQKSVDYVLCDKLDLGPVLAIELDDASHERTDRVERDVEVERILAQAGLPLLRINGSTRLEIAELAKRIELVLSPSTDR